MIEPRELLKWWIAVTVVTVMMMLVGCCNVQEWRKTVTEHQLQKVRVTEVYYKSDTGFDLGTEGLGEYYLIKVEGF